MRQETDRDIRERVSLRARADRIFFGELRGRQDDFLDDKENDFAYAFLLLTEKLNGKVVPVDEARLKNCEDPLDYLRQTENVHANYFELEYGWWKYDIGSFLGFYGDDKKPVLLLNGNRGYQMWDPRTNTRWKVDRNSAGKLDDRAIYILPRFAEEAKDGLELVRIAMRRQHKEIWIFMLMLIAASLISMMVPLGIRYITDTAIPNSEIGSINVMVISLFLGVVAGLLVNIVVNRIKVRMQTRISYGVLASVFGRIMSMASGDEKKLADRITGLILPFVQAIETLINSGLGVSVFLVQSLIVLYVIRICDPANSLRIYLLVGVEILVAVMMQGAIFRNTLRGREAESRMTAARREMLDNMEAIRSGALEEKIYYRFALAYDERTRIRLKVQNTNQWMTIIGTLVSGFGVLMIYTQIASAGKTDLGNVSAVVSSFALMVSYMNCLLLACVDIAGSIPHLNFATRILKTPVETREAGGVERELTGSIELNNVSFAYSEDANPVVRDLSLKVQPGEYIGIVGTSGCGKSTLLRLMLGFLKPTGGSVSYDGIEFDQYNPRAIRRQFGVVLQDAAVISGSIRRNIGLSDDVDLDRVKEAARSAAIYDEIEAMPMKFETLLSSEAELISGGQRQRIVLARALMNRPKILFLDEATSAMDNISQKKVKNNLDELGITRIAVAHRLSTIIDCDRILVMDKGEIVEQGNFQELMAMDGLFARMARRNLV